MQLSYLGTIGIIIFNKTIKNFLDNLKFIKNNIKIKRSNKLSKIVDSIKDMISVTLSAQIIILPVMLYHFNIIGIYFLLANILVSIIITPIMILAIIFVFLSFINLEISKFISIFLSWGIEGLIQIANLSNLPFSKIYVATPKIFTIIIYYILILVFNQIYKIYTNKEINNTEKRIKNLIALAKYNVYLKRRKLKTFFVSIKLFGSKNKITLKNKIISRDKETLGDKIASGEKMTSEEKITSENKIRIIVLKACRIFCVILILVVIIQLNQKLEIHFLDVGQGDSCFIVTPHNKTILVDGGGSTSSSFDVGKDTLIPYILDRGYTKIDYIFISHFDQDHVGGILTVLQELRVEKIYISKQGVNSQNYEKFLEIVSEKKLDVQVVKAGDKILIDNLSFNILWPTEKQISENILNNNAIVMKLHYRNFSMLFTGDIEEPAEKAILNTYKNKLEIFQSTILKVAHHGSKSSSTQEFLDVVKPKIALIGVGENNLFGHPNPHVVERLEECGTKIFRTDESGEINVQLGTFLFWIFLDINTSF